MGFGNRDFLDLPPLLHSLLHSLLHFDAMIASLRRVYLPTLRVLRRTVCHQVDIRVGVIERAWEHPDSDRLWCEEIAVGDEEGPREIASGLRGHFSLEEMTGRRCLVVCNLKPAKLRGFKSNGMVLWYVCVGTGSPALANATATATATATHCRCPCQCQ